MKLKMYLNRFLSIFVLIIISSCSSSEEGGENNNPQTVEESIYISLNQYDFFLGSNVTFFAYKDNGQSVTTSSVFYVDGVEISGNSYLFPSVGTYAVYAKKDEVQSEEVTIKIVESTHTTKVMVEDYTGTWCGYCPRLATALENTVNLDSNVIPVAIHDDNDMLFPYANEMENAFSVTGFPTGKVNRTITWNESTSQPISYTDERQKMGLAINSSISGNVITAEVKVHYDLGESNDQRLVVYLLENGLVYPQENYYNGDTSSPWYQAGNPIQNFVHDHVARATFTDVFGDAIPANERVTGNTYTADLSMSIPGSVQDTDNLEIVAFVVGADNKVRNVQKANLGENKDFD